MVSSCAHECGDWCKSSTTQVNTRMRNFSGLMGFAAPNAALDVPYPWNLLVGLLRRASQVKSVVKERKATVQCWFVLLPVLQELSLLPCKKSPGTFPDRGGRFSRAVEELEAASLGQRQRLSAQPKGEVGQLKHPHATSVTEGSP